MSKPKGTKKPKQAVNQFLHSNRPSRAPKGNSENVEYDIEIRSPVYPNENGVIIVKVQGQKDLGVQLQITNRFPSSVVFDRLTKKRKDLPMKPIKIQSGESVYHTVQVHINGLDHVYTYLNFDFHIKETGTKISKKITISTQVFNPDVNELKPTSSYKRPPAAKFQKGVASQIIYPAPRLEIEQRNDLPKIKLGQYFIPDSIRRMVNRGFREDAQEMESFLLGQRRGPGRYANPIQPENKYVVEIKNILKSKLTKDNYKKIFTLLLYFEEMQAEINMDRFTIEKTPMFCTEENEKGIFLTLEIAGIVDSSANICKYGTVGVRFIEDDGSLSTSMYEGNIKGFRINTISLHFGKELRQIYYDDMQFQVQFVSSRHNIRFQHRALELIQKYDLWPVLLPLNKNIGHLGIKPLEIRNFFDKNIGKNPEQQTAVRNIVSGVSRPCPYIIFGPPGTGKTVTIVESMKQVISLDPESHILACAFSNAAADILLEKLLNFIPGIKLLRMYAVYVDYFKIPKELRIYSNFDGDGIAFYPSKKKLKDYRIIISTISTVGRLSSPKLMGHFSHIFIDECGFCMEPKIIVAFAGILDLSKTQLVLAGDPKQLGPIVTSPFAQEYKLDISLLERLMTTIPIYERQADEKYDQRVITKLLKNYRSHPVILKVCNDLFYDNELQACANMRKVSEFCKWDVLPRTGFPLFIHSIVGEERREGNSYYNSEEAITAVEYIKKLRQHASQIGVITPYSKQVQKINILLQREKIKNVKVNSVEKFLGDEKKIIILSTVRSNPNDQENDYTNCMLGFLANKKRFNVAVSRPQALLIVVGNVKCLYSDPNWASLISYCQENEAIKGESLDSKHEIIDFVTHKLAEQAITEPDSQAEVS